MNILSWGWKNDSLLMGNVVSCSRFVRPAFSNITDPSHVAVQACPALKTRLNGKVLQAVMKSANAVISTPQPRSFMKKLTLAASLVVCSAVYASDHLVFEGGEGPGKGKHVVLLAGDEEYRSEEAMPQMARILSTRHGFKTTVLFSVNDKGEVDPTAGKSLSNPAALDSADAIVMAGSR
jgi:hypothetical protein